MFDFNNAYTQNSFDLIPTNTIVKARLVIKPGNDINNPFIMRSKTGESAYLNCEFIILEGPYAKRKVFDKIGLEGSEKWVSMGKARIRAILESAKGINPKDISETAVEARKINCLEDLNNLDVVIKIGIDHDSTGQYPDKNRVIAIITPEHISYSVFMTGQDVPFGF